MGAAGAAATLSATRPWLAAADEVAGAGASSASRLEAALEGRTHTFALPNGLRFIVVTRPDAPVVSVNTYVSAGAWVEADGETGVAHLLEHLAFKGTPRIGSRDWGKEERLLTSLDEVFYSLREARRDGREEAAAGLEEELERLQSRAQELVEPNAFAQALTAAGAVGLNAATSHDATRYYVSLPANQLELWFALEAERFSTPVFRELYREKQVVEEERASRIENSPIGAFFYDYSLRALSNPYRRPVLGFREDLEALGRREVADFFARYYHPRNTTVAIVGAAEPEAVLALAEKYFGGWAPAVPSSAITVAPSPAQLDAEGPPRPLAAAAGGAAAAGAAAAGSGKRPPRRGPAAGGQRGPLDYAVTSRAGPLAVCGYYRPPLLAPSGRGVALQVACDLLAAGRTARLSALSQSGKLLAASATPSFPGTLHAGLALVTAIPTAGDSPQHAAALLQAELDRLALAGPSSAELARVKKAARTELLDSLTNNPGLASTLVTYQAVTGSWQGVLKELAQIEALTAADVRDAAATIFDPANSITALVAPERTPRPGGRTA